MNEQLRKIKQLIAQAPLYKIIRFGYLFTIILIITCLVGLFYFLYNNFYETLSQTKKIELLRKQVPLEAVNTKLFQIVEQRLQQKTNNTTTTEISNPFTKPAEIATSTKKIK
ncbi:MAG: hypothetical protein WCW02_02100 [Candidatus Buchananbacteria bacterium]